MIRPLLFILALSTVAGCATAPSAPRSGAAVAPYHEAADFSGRIGINYSRDGKKESLTGTFNWQQTRASTDVTLISPTGQTVAVIRVTPQLATLTASGEPPRSAPDLDTLTAQTLGFSLPVTGLREWLQGHATDHHGQRFVASPANDNVVTRDGWKLEYSSWQDENAAVPRPKRIDVTRLALGQAVDDMQIRIVIDPSGQ
jgi:outer membrane lipoprotein LolB